MKLAEYAGNIIKELRTSKNLTQEELGKKLGVGKTTVANYESGYRMPKQDLLFKLSDILDVSIDTFFPSNETTLDSVYNKLDNDRKQKVYNFAEQQLHEQISVVKENLVKLPTIENSYVAANPTQLAYGDIDIEEKEFANVPHGADYAITIKGDSMEPIIKDGDIIFYREQPDVENGEIVIVEIDGDGVTCKKIYFDFDDDKVILHSLNTKYEDRELEPERVRIIGKVLI